MKILENKYPLGSLNGQKTPGRYIDGALYENLKILAENIVRDMTYLGIASSSTLEVGTGKSVFITQVGEAYTDLVNQIHGTNLTFDMNNVVFKPRDLIERAFKLPKYSCIVLDEWEDASYWSELSMTLRQFFRKCRQLNLFILVICPNFFQVPMAYAISRSVFFCDIKFMGTFERGFFSFYNFHTKKTLYIKGKKTHDYSVVQPNFSGRFTDGYGVPEQEYRKAKFLDMTKEDKEGKPPSEKEITRKLFKQLYANLPKITIKDLAKGFGISERTAYRYLSDESDENLVLENSDTANLPGNNNILIDGTVGGAEGEEAEE